MISNLPITIKFVKGMKSVRSPSEYEKDKNGHFNTSNGVTDQGNINSLPGNLKDPVFLLGRNRLNDIR